MKNTYQVSLLILSMTLLASCGNGGGGGSSSSSQGPAIQEQTTEGSYRAILRPYNNSLSGFLPTGAAEISVAGDAVSVKTYLDDDAKVSHMQSIHTGSRCPSPSDDKNGDGLIDYSETLSVVGEVLLPLDADINSASEGEGTYPMGGGFTYVKNASLSKLESDVRTRLGQNLNLAGRAVILHGASPSSNLPTSVATFKSLAPAASIPIVCGILQRQE